MLSTKCMMPTQARRLAARKEAEREHDGAAIVIQKSTRNRLSKKKERKTRQEQAAVSIQAATEGRLARVRTTTVLYSAVRHIMLCVARFEQSLHSLRIGWFVIAHEAQAWGHLTDFAVCRGPTCRYLVRPHSRHSLGTTATCAIAFTSPRTQLSAASIVYFPTNHKHHETTTRPQSQHHTALLSCTLGT